MKEVTNLMINEFKILELGYDFMGYKISKNDHLTYHHLIIPKRNGGALTRQNGAIIQRIPHDYLHLIERIDYDTFCYITSEMIDMNIKGFLSCQNIANIHSLLREFESKYDGHFSKKGKLLIKHQYKQGRINF